MVAVLLRINAMVAARIMSFNEEYECRRFQLLITTSMYTTGGTRCSVASCIKETRRRIRNDGNNLLTTLIRVIYAVRLAPSHL